MTLPFLLSDKGPLPDAQNQEPAPRAGKLCAKVPYYSTPCLNSGFFLINGKSHSAK